jgi:ADP-ribosylglycohydrolase
MCTKPDYDRVKGCIFGCALGDALGLPAEGITKEILAERYPAGITLPHQHATRGFPLNDFSDDTDQTVLIMRALAGTDDAAIRFARGLKQWYAQGFPELGDTFGMGCGGMTWRVLKRDEFASDPFAAASSIVGPRSGNGALMRTAPCAFMADAAGWARHICATTHCDPLAEATCAAQCLLIRGLSEVPTGAKPSKELLRSAIVAAIEPLSAAQRREFLEWAERSLDLSALELDSRDARGYTLKSFACSIWAFRHIYSAHIERASLFRTVITHIVMAGGDADTNAAIAGACLGAYLGYSQLPQDWIESLPHYQWLEREIDIWYTSLN